MRKQLHRALRTLKQSLYAYQREGVERFFARGRLLLADDMGLGKTAQAIAACHVLWHTGRVRRGLLVVPAALKPQWVREWQAFTDAPAAVVEGTPGERRVAFEACRRGFLLVNYEQLIRDLDVVREWAPDIVVLDEAQRIKNWATKTALSVKRLDPPYPSGADRHADGEPARGAGVDRRVGRRHRAGAESGAWLRGTPRRWMERRRSAAPGTSTRCGRVWLPAWSDACGTRCCRSCQRGPTRAFPSR